MAILRNKIQSNFVMVPKYVFMDNTLKLRECGLICKILSLPDNWDFTVKGLMKITGEGRDSIRTSIKILKEKGYLIQYQDRDEKGVFGKNIIEICPDGCGEPFSENPTSGKPTSGKPISAEPTSGKLPQYNNKQSNNNTKFKNNGYRAQQRKDQKNGTGNRTENGWTDTEKEFYGI